MISMFGHLAAHFDRGERYAYFAGRTPARKISGAKALVRFSRQSVRVDVRAVRGLNRFMFKSLSQHADFGLLIGRLGIGAIFIVSGWHKLSGGQAAWTHIGHAMTYLGIGFMPSVWGLLSALAEFLGGILLVLGFLFRPAAILILLNMFVAAVTTFRQHPHDFVAYSRPIEMLCVLIILLFVGPGKFSIDKG